MFENIQYPIVDTVAQFWMIFGFFGLPIVTTVFNLYNLFYQNKKLKPFFELVTILVGPFYSVILYGLYMKDAVGADQLPICTEYLLPIEVLAGIAIIGYIIYWIFRTKLNSVYTIFCIATMYIGVILSLVYIYHIIPNIAFLSNDFGEGLLTCIFPLNYVIISISAFVQISLSKNAGAKDPNFLKKTWVRFLVAIVFMA